MPEPQGGVGAAPGGRWLGEPAGASSGVEERSLFLAPGRLSERPGSARLEVRSPQTTGRAAGGWLVASPREQAEDDAHSLCFDGEPLEEPLELLGAPELVLVAASSRPIALVAVRLCELTPDGVSTRVSYGLWNLTHAQDHASWSPLVPGRDLEVAVRLNQVAHTFARGSRIRLALSSAYWPLAWPSPEPVTLSVRTDACRLRLPVRKPGAPEPMLSAFAPAEGARSHGWTPLARSEFSRRVEVEPESGELVANMRSGYGASGGVAHGRCEPIDLEGGDGSEISTRIHADDPLRARAVMAQRTELRRRGWQVAVETEVKVSCTREDLRVEARLAAAHDGREVFVRRWDERVRREGI